MAQTATSEGRCIALTADGERCSRTAGSDDFCYQHDESDQTVSDAETASDEESSETDQSSGDQSSDNPADQSEPELDEIEVTADVDDDRIEEILSIRQTVKSTAGGLVGHPFDGVSEITPAEEGWNAVVEVIERESVPDTQDVIGRYRINLDEDGTIEGYRRLDRYRRGDTAAFDPVQ